MRRFFAAQEIVHGIDKGKPFKQHFYTFACYLRRNGSGFPAYIKTRQRNDRKIKLLSHAPEPVFDIAGDPRHPWFVEWKAESAVATRLPVSRLRPKLRTRPLAQG